MMSTKGQAIRIAMKEIPTLGRATQGVRIMRMSEGDTVASIGIVLPEEENEETAEPSNKSTEPSNKSSDSDN